MVAVKCLMSLRHPSTKRGNDDHFILHDWSLSRKNISGLLGSSHLCSDFIDFGLISRQLVSEPLVLSNAVYVLNRILADLINLIFEILSWLSTLMLINLIALSEENLLHPLFSSSVSASLAALLHAYRVLKETFFVRFVFLLWRLKLLLHFYLPLGFF